MERALGYAEACEALKRALVFGINPSLDGVVALCDALERPQDSFISVQVAGTNGKSSTARYLHALARAHGRRAGLYTSPELERINERIEIADGPVSDAEFAAAVSAAVGAAEKLRPRAQGTEAGFTEFELMTAAALWLFREREVDTAVLEVGMGGRWDATSVVAPAVAVITGIGLDHTAILGETIDAIAAEKAAIIRPDSIPVLGPGTAGLEEVLLGSAKRIRMPVRLVRPLDEVSAAARGATVRYEISSRPETPGGCTVVDVLGTFAEYRAMSVRAPAYQAANVATAVTALEALLGEALDLEPARRALGSTVVPGRFELLREQPPVVVDGAHNPQASSVLAAAIVDAWPDPHVRPRILLGVLADKDATGIVRALAGLGSEFFVTAPESPRALPVGDLATAVERVTGVAPTQATPIDAAVSACVESSPNGLVITGSLTTVGQARRRLLDASATA